MKASEKLEYFFAHMFVIIRVMKLVANHIKPQFRIPPVPSCYLLYNSVCFSVTYPGKLTKN